MLERFDNSLNIKRTLHPQMLSHSNKRIIILRLQRYKSYAYKVRLLSRPSRKFLLHFKHEARYFILFL